MASRNVFNHGKKLTYEFLEVQIGKGISNTDCHNRLKHDSPVRNLQSYLKHLLNMKFVN